MADEQEIHDIAAAYEISLPIFRAFWEAADGQDSTAVYIALVMCLGTFAHKLGYCSHHAGETFSMLGNAANSYREQLGEATAGRPN